MARVFLVFATFLCLAACGFRPLYQNASTLDGGTTALDGIGIADIVGSPGLALHNALVDRFYNNGTPQNPRYILATSVDENTRDLVIQKNDTTTRAQMVLSASYSLTDKASRAVIDKGTIRAVSSYNILPSQYSTLVTQNDARDRSVRELADKITTRMSVVLQGK